MPDVQQRNVPAILRSRVVEVAGHLRPGFGPAEARGSLVHVSPSHVLQLCVMNDRARKPERVGIRELRQNLSVYVRRVREDGRAYEVTERGEPVARLTPLEGRPMSHIERMTADGRIAPASRAWDELPPPITLPAGRPLSEVLQELRDEDER
jgi:prevent-host-death family protein